MSLTSFAVGGLEPVQLRGALAGEPAFRSLAIEVAARAIVERGVEIDSIQYYLDFFRYGAPPHGGFGFGLTRLLMQMLAQENVREVTFLYRGPHRLTP